MSDENRGLGIVFHSGSYDRVQHGLSIAAIAAAFEQKVITFWTFWSLECLKKSEKSYFKLDEEAEKHRGDLEQHLEKGHLQKIHGLISRAKKLGVEFYTCSNSMELHKLTMDDLVEEIDDITGIGSFLSDIEDYQTLFI